VTPTTLRNLRNDVLSASSFMTISLKSRHRPSIIGRGAAPFKAVGRR
jgi:hypothetical protein